jgi:hypothetical protein
MNRKDGRLFLYRVTDKAVFQNEPTTFYYMIEFEWEFKDGNIGLRQCRTQNPNVAVFMEDMLKKLGHKKTEKKVW